MYVDILSKPSLKQEILVEFVRLHLPSAAGYTKLKEPMKPPFCRACGVAYRTGTSSCIIPHPSRLPIITLSSKPQLFFSIIIYQQ